MKKITVTIDEGHRRDMTVITAVWNGHLDTRTYRSMTNADTDEVVVHLVKRILNMIREEQKNDSEKTLPSEDFPS